MRILPVALIGVTFGVVSACSSEVDTSGSTTTTTSGTGGVGSVTAVTHAAVTVGAGTGGAPDIGMPSTTYPAPHGAPPTVTDSQGPVLQAPTIIPIVFASDDAATKAAINDFTSKIGAGDYWHATTSEYGVGVATTGTPIELSEAAPTNIDDTAIQAWLAAKLNSDDPAFPAPTDNSLYAIYYPAGVDITLSGGQQGTSTSCHDFGGYHSNTALDAAHGNREVAYAVIPRCAHFGPLTGLDAVTGPASHEYIEAATDPYPMTTPAYGQVDNGHFYWEIILGGGETGDMCAQNDDAFQTFSEFNYVAQRTWSNKSVKAGHDPCVPTVAGQPYFNSVPVMNDTISVEGINIKGVKIPEGQSKVVDINLFSDGPTNGAWSVDAFDALAQQTGDTNLEFAFDATEGQNGQTLHLTINVVSASQYKAEVFVLTSTLGNTHHSYFGLVGN